MNINLVKQLREETKMRVRDCVSALERSNWVYEVALKTIASLVAQDNETSEKPLDKSPLMVLDESTGRIDVVYYDVEGRLIYRSGNIILGNWDDEEVIVDKVVVPKLETV